jgi:DNA-binding response OmpR family regulator
LVDAIQPIGAGRLNVGELRRRLNSGAVVKPKQLVVALVQDEPLLRVPLAQGLDSAGYKVLAAASGVEGLSLLEDRSIDVAVIDVSLPGRLDGTGLVREAWRQNPNLKIILTGAKALGGEFADEVPFLPKPFALAELIELIHQVFDVDERRVGSTNLSPQPPTRRDNRP